MSESDHEEWEWASEIWSDALKGQWWGPVPGCSQECSGAASGAAWGCYETADEAAAAKAAVVAAAKKNCKQAAWEQAQSVCGDTGKALSNCFCNSFRLDPKFTPNGISVKIISTKKLSGKPPGSKDGIEGSLEWGMGKYCIIAQLECGGSGTCEYLHHSGGGTA